jgi:hypothetical protein
MSWTLAMFTMLTKDGICYNFAASELLDTGVFSVSHRICAESAVDKQFDQQGGMVAKVFCSF